MQPGDAPGDAGPRRSHLLDSLKVYLNNGSRLQPIIGLSSIRECGTAEASCSDALYLCEVCVLQLGKADVRSHIMGSLHRYNYIRARHPHLVAGWKDDGDLCQLARPLMDAAKKLESEEGPGDVQLFQVDDTLFRRMLTSRADHAMALLDMTRDCGGQSNAAGAEPGWESEAALLEADQQVAQAEGSSRPGSQTPESGPSFLDGYRHLFGLCRVLECQNQEGQTRCFLCHCCCQRTNGGGIVYHLSSSLHLINHLMESRPEQMMALMPAVGNNKFPLFVLAQKVEEEEGGGRPQVLTLPESLCRLMTTRSYHWCLKALKKSQVHFSRENKKLNSKATNMSSVRKASQRKASATVFRVSLPLTKGSVLLQRTSFSGDQVPLSTEYQPSESPLHRWPGTEQHGGQEEGSAQEDPSGNGQEGGGGGGAANGGLVQAVRPDSLRVDNVLSSLVNGGSDDVQNWGSTRMVWLDQPPPTNSDPTGGTLWSGRGPSRGPSPETTSSPEPCYRHQLQCQYTVLGGPLAATGGTAAEPQPASHGRQWRTMVSCVPTGPYQAGPQGQAGPATAWCQTGGGRAQR